MTAPLDARADFPQLVAEASSPIDDVRGTAAYRRHAMSVLTKRALDRVLAVGPWGRLMTVALALGGQIALNHRLVPPGMARVVPGAQDPEVLIRMHRDTVERSMAAQAAA